MLLAGFLSDERVDEAEDADDDVDWLIRALDGATAGGVPFVLLDLLLFELVRSSGFSDDEFLLFGCWTTAEEVFELALVFDMLSLGFLLESFMLLLRSTADSADDGGGLVSLTDVPFCCVTTVDEEAAMTGDFLASVDK